ncbi:hypothetical protein [Nitratidesulfovibrio vulgaris]|jgi:hypothetical protein|uniref:hypothetical protein n=1 Tax=Nitratidesulfovibrio vulgaris TaxID=881 RepID=UPI0001A80292|nr:hypothetical protein [Nitratidesulfovibrio vulgaris]ADP85978.1 polypyrimidine track-binding protein, putative [Nitratidesulfovibrio vulgaris RCH1]WCB47531.1 hypothetical protein PH214_05485 [Nitratidesulfovibrio vulgaris]
MREPPGVGVATTPQGIPVAGRKPPLPPAHAVPCHALPLRVALTIRSPLALHAPRHDEKARPR